MKKKQLAPRFIIGGSLLLVTGLGVCCIKRKNRKFNTKKVMIKQKEDLTKFDKDDMSNVFKNVKQIYPKSYDFDDTMCGFKFREM